MRCPAAPTFRLGVYFLNDFASLLGQPVRVQVMQSWVLTGRPTSDNAQISIEFANGALANIFASFCVQNGDPYRDQVMLNFQHGTIRRWVERGPEHMADDWAAAELRRQGVAPVQAQTRPGAFAGWYNWRAFQNAIRSQGNVPALNADVVLFGVRLLEPCNAPVSAASRRPSTRLSEHGRLPFGAQSSAPRSWRCPAASRPPAHRKMPRPNGSWPNRGRPRRRRSCPRAVSAG